MNIYLVSLGCARNLVDSEVMLGHLTEARCTIIDSPEEADVIVVNTCSFITSAVDESIDTILEMAEYKSKGKCRYLVVAGCLPQRFGEDAVPEFPEVDLFLGTGGYERIAEEINRLMAVDGRVGKATCVLPDPNSVSPARTDSPRVTTTGPLAYLKIAEGCNRHCTYCIIPTLRGKYRSRSIEDITAEAQRLLDGGVQELNLVAESTTDYGEDLGEPGKLSQVLSSLSEIATGKWLRFLYAFPDTLDDATIKLAAEDEAVCAYFDIPIQHASDPIIRKMGRQYTQEDLRVLFTRLRAEVPGVALRTTLIVGFPGETEEDFQTLLDFITEVEFDHLGVFTYCDSEEQASHVLPDHVDEEVAQKRQDTIMAAQEEISARRNMARVGNTYRVLIEENPEEGVFIGRTFFQAPEVDGLTFVYGEGLTVGAFVDVRITDAIVYDLSGEVV
ncbi:30S ribosomal protein S12 methylthiotransferase RimO [Desulfoluna sp.]|uniref:30S ribosomal protein S12 methylthiotransferase RimO n=1 Tax=Desulfoluna sp. TaxID=2045199 RepID=UPI00260219B0|nr:30S ribosomal protein S12 methylthiotransferase RimO [Desulfoluna sp.]